MPPMTAIMLKCCPATLMSNPVWNSGYSRATRNTPATTIVLGVQQRADRCRPGHGVGQPRVQRELTALADAGDEERDRTPQQHRGASRFR